MTSKVKLIPKGVAIQRDGSWVYQSEIGVRETTADDVAVIELTQTHQLNDIEGVDEEDHSIAVSQSQIVALRDVLEHLIRRNNW